MRVRLDLDVGPTGTTKNTYNVIGEIRGKGKLADEVVVIGGHLDSWDLGTGAIDDGAGVAITMAAGARIGRLAKAPRRTIRVIAFANEEQGLYGGKAYAKPTSGTGPAATGPRAISAPVASTASAPALRPRRGR